MSMIVMTILILTKIMINISTQFCLWRGTSFHLLRNASATVYHILTLTNCYVTQISSTLGKLFFSTYLLSSWWNEFSHSCFLVHLVTDTVFIQGATFSDVWNHRYVSWYQSNTLSHFDLFCERFFVFENTPSCQLR